MSMLLFNCWINTVKKIFCHHFLTIITNTKCKCCIFHSCFFPFFPFRQYYTTYIMLQKWLHMCTSYLCLFFPCWLFQVYTTHFKPIDISLGSTSIGSAEMFSKMWVFQSDWAINPILNELSGCMQMFLSLDT